MSIVNTSEFNWYWYNQYRLNSEVPALPIAYLKSTRQVSNENTSLQSHCSVHLGPGPHGRTEDFDPLNELPRLNKIFLKVSLGEYQRGIASIVSFVPN